MSTTQVTAGLSNAEFKELVSRLQVPRAQLSQAQMSLRQRAADAGYMDEGLVALRGLGFARILRMHELPQPASTNKTVADAVQVSIFRKNDFADFADAGESGALYPLQLPDGKQTNIAQLQSVYNVMRTVADSMCHDPDAFDVVVYDGYRHQILTEELRQDVLSALKLPDPKLTMGSVLNRASASSAEPEKTFSLVLHRAHDYGDDTAAFESAARDGALRAIPVDLKPFYDGISEDGWRMMSMFEQAAKTAASCLDGNSNVMVLMEVHRSPHLQPDFITLNELMEAYTVTGLDQSQPDAVSPPLQQVIETAMSQREQAQRANLPQDVIEFADKAVELFVKLSKDVPDMKRDDLLCSIDQYAPAILGKDSIALLSAALSQSSITALSEQPGDFASALKPKLKQSMLTQISNHLAREKEVPVIKSPEHPSEQNQNVAPRPAW